MYQNVVSWTMVRKIPFLRFTLWNLCNFKQIWDACKSNTVYISRKVNLKKGNI